MNRYIKLVSFEINRMMKLYISVLSIAVIIQFATVWIERSKYLTSIKNIVTSKQIKTFLMDKGNISLERVVNNPLFTFSIILCAVFILFYIFMIWYRDYFGKNTFIYRLLMLPSSR